MCGYCVESHLFRQLIESAVEQEPMELVELFVPVYLQEADDLADGLHRAKEFKNYQYHIDTACCKFYEQSILHGFDARLSKLIMSFFEDKTITSYLDKRKSCIGETLWANLGRMDIYTSADSWNDFIQNTDSILNCSITILHEYANWWLFGHGKAQSDSPETRLKKTGVFDPIDNTTQNDFEKFYSIFPVLYFALMFVSKHASNSSIIKSIALKSPHDVPGFWGEDLWLQRKAFVHCVKNYGLEFLLDRIENNFIAPTTTDLKKRLSSGELDADDNPLTSLELISCVLLKINFEVGDYYRIKEAILNKESHFAISYLYVENVLDLIDTLIKLPGIVKTADQSFSVARTTN